MNDNKPIIIHLSFKNNDIEDIHLFNWITSHKYKSAFIKSILRQVMKEELNRE